MALAPQESQILILRQVVEIYDETISTNLLNSIMQQAFHEAIQNADLIPLLKAQMTGHKLVKAVLCKNRLFEVMAYIHFLARTNDIKGIERLCDDLEEHFTAITAILDQNDHSYKIFQMLARLQCMSSAPTKFFKTVLPGHSIVKLAKKNKNTNWVVNAIIAFTDHEHRDIIANEFIADMATCVRSPAHYCLKALCDHLENPTTMANFSKVFVRLGYKLLDSTDGRDGEKTPPDHVWNKICLARTRLGLPALTQ